MGDEDHHQVQHDHEPNQPPYAPGVTSPEIVARGNNSDSDFGALNAIRSDSTGPIRVKDIRHRFTRSLDDN